MEAPARVAQQNFHQPTTNQPTTVEKFDTICFTICLFISPDLNLDGNTSLRYVSRYFCSLVRT
jgi:hypothetical protein